MIETEEILQIRQSPAAQRGHRSVFSPLLESAERDSGLACAGWGDLRRQVLTLDWSNQQEGALNRGQTSKVRFSDRIRLHLGADSRLLKQGVVRNAERGRMPNGVRLCT